MWRQRSCAPLKHRGVRAGDKVGVIGFGGLGDMAAALGAKGVVESDADALAALKFSFDLMLSTISQKHDINPFPPLLKRGRTFCNVGALEPMAPKNNMLVAAYRKSGVGLLIGNLADTQGMLDFSAEHGIGPDVQVIPIQQINDAYKHVEKAEMRFRHAIDLASLKHEMAAA